MDMISKLPTDIIETILCLLPIQEAVRTSILAAKWRYIWIKIPKLTFIEDTFQVPTEEDELYIMEQTFYTPSIRKDMNKRCKLFDAIYQVLLMHKGPINEFTLSTAADYSCVEIYHILRYLSRKNTVKKLTLDFTGEYPLPLSIFSFRQLTDLYLSCCDLDRQPTFSGLGGVTSFYVEDLTASIEELLNFLSKCRLLKSVTVKFGFDTIKYTFVNLFECLRVVESLFLPWSLVIV